MVPEGVQASKHNPVVDKQAKDEEEKHGLALPGGEHGLNGVGGGVGVLLVVPESTSLLLPPSSVLFFSQQVLGPCAADAFAQVNARHHVACASQRVSRVVGLLCGNDFED